MSDVWRVLLVAFFVVVSPNLTPAATVADQAVFNVIQEADPALASRKVLYRNAVAADLDLVIAIGSPAEWPLDPHKSSTFLSLCAINRFKIWNPYTCGNCSSA